jgi:hypothetical protein
MKQLLLLICLLFTFISLSVNAIATDSSAGSARIANFDALLDRQTQPGTFSTTELGDGTFLLENKLQALEAHVTPSGVRFQSIGNSIGKGGFGLQLSKWGRVEQLHTAESLQIYRDNDVVFHAHRSLNNLNVIVEKFTSGSDGIRQDFIVPVRPQGSGDLHVQLRVIDASVITKAGGAEIALASGRHLTYDRLAVKDSNGKALQAGMKKVGNDTLEIVINDVGASYPLTIDPTVGDANWVAMNVLPGTDGEIKAIAIPGVDIYIGGTFSVLGNIYAKNIAHWNGSEWSALSTGTDASVNALAVDGAGNLYAGGEFITAGGVIVNQIAVWNGSNWSGIDGGIAGNAPQVNALLFDKNGNLYVGGHFSRAGKVSAARVAMWNGTVWSRVGFGFNAKVNALAFDGVGNLYAGGEFSKTGGQDASLIAKWNGVTWSALDSGITSAPLGSYLPLSYVYSLQVDNANNLYVAGKFNIAGGVRVSNLARWNGSAWNAMGGFSHTVNSLALDSKGNLLAAGEFILINDLYVYHIARWNGTGWTGLGSGLDGNVKALALDSNNNLLAGGTFIAAGAVGATNIANWNGTEWCVVVNGGMGDSISALVTDANGHLYVGGQFRSVPGINPVYYIAEWRGDRWHTLGAGMDGGVNALVLDKQGNLYAGGWFENVGDLAVNGIARWNGSTWSALGNGMDDAVYTLVVDRLGILYAGGAFTVAGNVDASYIARWDGTRWKAMGTGVDDYVYALAVDSNNNLYAGGDFLTAGDLENTSGVARWNGFGWKALGAGLDGSVETLAVDNSNNLYAGGYFIAAGDIDDATFLAKWDGSNWGALGTGVNSPVSALAFDSRGNLFVGGYFTDAGGVTANRIAKWNGSQWAALGSGLDNSVLALAFDSNDTLFVGGTFIIAGGTLSPYLAQWPVPDSDGDGFNDNHDAFPANAAAAVDSDGDGFPDGWLPGNPYRCASTALSCNHLFLDADDDNDGVVDALDNCLRVSNPDQQDTNGDGLGNACDGDNDGIENAVDNCPLLSSPDQLNTDGDSEGNACDSDDDNDGVPDALDSFPLMPNDQIVLGTFSGTMEKEYAGKAVAFAGDVNADGYGDYAIGIPGYDIPVTTINQSIKNAGRIVVLSGKNSSVLMSVNGSMAKDALGTAVAGNVDVDHDGYADVVVGAPNADNAEYALKDAGSVTILFGPDGVRQQTFYGSSIKALAGSAVALGDVNGDLYADIIIGAPKDDDIVHNLVDAGSVTILSGNGFSLLNTFYGTAAKAYAGSSVETGDVNHDRLADVIVGAPSDDDLSRALKDCGSVSVYTNDGVLLLKKYGATAKAALGKSVASGDVNKDGFDDVVVGAPGDKTLRDAGSVTVYAGNSGVELANYYGATAKAALGNSVAVGDIDGDGFDDIMVGAWKEDVASPLIHAAGSVSFWSVRKRTEIDTLFGSTAKEYFGSAVALGDINNDGHDDLIIGSSNLDLPGEKLVKDVGSVQVLSGAVWGM